MKTTDTNKELAAKMRYLDGLIKSLPLGEKKRQAVKLYHELREQRKYAL